MSRIALPRIYLAGSIRNGVRDDIEWREETTQRLHGLGVFLNPLGGKMYDPITGLWTISGITSTGSVIVPHDFWCVDHADICIFNFLALADCYPNIGTLVEFGRSTARDHLRYVIMNREHHTRHHPFITESAAAIFQDVEACLRFLERHLGVLSGMSPHFAGMIRQEECNEERTAV